MVSPNKSLIRILIIHHGIVSLAVIFSLSNVMALLTIVQDLPETEIGYDKMY